MMNVMRFVISVYIFSLIFAEMVFLKHICILIYNCEMFVKNLNIYLKGIRNSILRRKRSYFLYTNRQ